MRQVYTLKLLAKRSQQIYKKTDQKKVHGAIEPLWTGLERKDAQLRTTFTQNVTLVTAPGDRVRQYDSALVVAL